MVLPVFGSIDGTEYSVNNLVCVGGEDNCAIIQTMNAEGQFTGEYAWNEAYEGYPAGWYDDDGNLAKDTLKPGDAVFFNAAANSVSLQSTGIVQGSISRTISRGYSMLGNCATTDIDVNNLKIVDGEDNCAIIQIMDSDGQFIGEYAWNVAYESYPEGWYDDDGNLAEITLKSGEAVFFNATKDSVKITIPSTL